ncbi:MAG: hypothetical protein N0A16_12455 [Blastocatellia bacterium]|nr:hypothetical protein [Blastocatellia bacterium]MDW8167799.1 hypothetical protein [Acidobacteriota bacterium]
MASRDRIVAEFPRIGCSWTFVALPPKRKIAAAPDATGDRRMIEPLDESRLDERRKVVLNLSPSDRLDRAAGRIAEGCSRLLAIERSRIARAEPVRVERERTVRLLRLSFGVSRGVFSLLLQLGFHLDVWNRLPLKPFERTAGKRRELLCALNARSCRRGAIPRRIVVPFRLDVWKRLLTRVGASGKIEKP